MTEESVKMPKPIELPDHLWQEILERERRDQIKRNEDFAKKLAQMLHQEREELKRMQEIESAPKTRTDEELRLEDERAIQLLEQMRRDGSY